MKNIILIFSLLLTSLSFSQTKLINHKSHSGTNLNFNPKKIDGNFGLFPITEEIEKNDNSSYKLVSRFGPGQNGVAFTLFKTENKTLKKTMCMSSDTVIENIRISDNSELQEDIQSLLIKRLKKLRSKE